MHRFNFNLLPEKSKEEVKKVDERETTSLTLAFLPFLAVIIGIVLIVVNNVVLQSNINSWEAAIKQKEQEISQYQSVISLNIEFANKTVLLEEPVQKDVEPEQFFSLSESILASLPFSAEIKKYGRNIDGSFDITLSTEGVGSAAEIMRAFELNENVQSPNLKTFTNLEEELTVDTTVNFFLVEEDTSNNG